MLTTLTFDSDIIEKDLKDVMNELIDSLDKQGIKIVSNEIIYGLEKQLLTLAFKSILKKSAPHINVGCMYIDRMFRTNDSEAIIDIPSFCNIEETMSKNYGRYFMEMGNTSIFIDVIHMTPRVYLCIKNMEKDIMYGKGINKC